MRRIFIWLIVPAFLASCAFTAEPKWASDEAVSQAVYVDDGPTSLTLFTVINNRSGAGAHAGLMINGSQRLLFDPAGTWWSPSVPERNDVHYGFTPRVLANYLDYHTRETFRTVVQTIEVSPEVAEAAIRAVQAYGAVPKAQCTVAITAILKGLPGFEEFPRSWFPKVAMRALEKYPGVTTEVIYDDDADDNSGVLAGQQS